MKTFNCKISKMYAQHIDAIARIWLEEQESPTATMRRVRGELGLKTFKRIQMVRWADKAEWKAAIEAARKHIALKAEFSPNVRGTQYLEWVRMVLGEHRTAYDEAKATGDEKHDNVARDLEYRIQKLSDSARSEEKHMADMRNSEAIRDMRRFASAMLKELAECDLSEAAHARLVEIAKNPVILLKD